MVTVEVNSYKLLNGDVNVVKTDGEKSGERSSAKTKRNGFDQIN